jgi:general secretion pathway protein N
LRTQGHSVQGKWHLSGIYDDERWLPLNWQLQTAESGLTGDLWLTGYEQWRASARGHINVAEFSQQIRRSGGAIIEGDVRVQSLHGAVDDSRVSRLDGLATWPGGRVSWQLGNQSREAVLPPMEARLGNQSGQFKLEISTAAEQAPVVTAMLGEDGIARIEMYRRMLDLVNQSWAGDAGPGEVVFSVEQPVLPGGF